MPDVGAALFTTYLYAVAFLTATPTWMVLTLLPNDGAAADRLVRGWCRLIVRLSGCRLEVTGAQHLPRSQSAVLVANHASYLDSVILMAVVPDCRFVAEDGVLTWPYVGTAVRKARHLTVDRRTKAGRLACGAAMATALEHGESLLVYPEGRRADSGEMLPFRLGAFRAAVAAGRPIVPITVSGTRSMLPRGRRLVRRGPVWVTIHQPIEPLGHDRAEMVRLRQTARDRIAASLEATPASG